ncbi:hypothetical protein [Myroides sp. LJL119]
MSNKILLILLLFKTGLGFANQGDKYDQKIVKAQNYKDNLFGTKIFSNLSISAGASTMGATVELITPVAKNFKARLGIDFFRYKTPQFSMNFQDNSGILQETFHTIPTLKTKADIHLFHGHLLFDYYPIQNGIVYLTAGLYVGNTKINANGRLEDHTGNLITLKPGKQWPEIIFDGKKLEVFHAKVDAQLKLGQVVKPYLGIGLGRSIPKNKIGLKIDFGLIYQGEYSLTQNGNNIPVTKQSDIYIENSKKYTKWLKWWPKAALQLTYRIY